MRVLISAAVAVALLASLRRQWRRNRPDPMRAAAAATQERVTDDPMAALRAPAQDAEGGDFRQ